MERLTKRVGVDEAVPICDFDICAPFQRAGKCKTGTQCFPFGGWERHCNDTCILGRMIDHLAAYEDTGLTPEEIAKMAKELQQIEEKKAQADKLAEMVDLAAHAIGLSNKKAYFRHGKYWYKPYRNYYCNGHVDDPVWEEMVQLGYAVASKGLGSILYHLTREGLDWLGQQTSIKIHDPEA